MKTGNKPPMTYLTQTEYSTIQLALGQIIFDLTNPQAAEQPWTPQARKMMSKIVENAKSVGQKIERVTGIKACAAAFKPGDEQEFLTKES